MSNSRDLPPDKTGSPCADELMDFYRRRTEVKILIAVLAMILITAPAKAEIICTNRGCWETGMRIFRNGGVYRGLAHHNNREMTVDSKGYPKRGKPVRIIRDSW